MSSGGEREAVGRVDRVRLSKKGGGRANERALYGGGSLAGGGGATRGSRRASRRGERSGDDDEVDAVESEPARRWGRRGCFEGQRTTGRISWGRVGERAMARHWRRLLAIRSP
jgi:hypothetical protein